MKMIDVVINEKICYNTYTMCKWWEKNGNKRITRKYRNEQKGICEYFGIPYRTVTEWERGTRKMPDYVFRLLAYRIKMGNFAEKEEVDEE